MTSPDVAAAIAAGAPIMVAAGATEQHGDHLPLASDTLQGLDIGKRVARRLALDDIPFVVGPAIPFGPRPFRTESPRDLPGTVNLSHATLKAVFEEVCAELIEQGFCTVYLQLANAETDPILQLVAKELSERTPARVITLNWLIGIRSRYKGLMRATRPQSHGGEGETARMLATAPHLVRMDRAAGATTRACPAIPRSRPMRCPTSAAPSAAIARPTGCSTTRSAGSGVIPASPLRSRAKGCMP